MFNREIMAKVDLRAPSVWLATWFGCGFMKKAPGTWGTAGALPFGVAIMYYGGVYALFMAVLLSFIVGLWAAKEFDAMAGGHDNSSIVIDEVAGVWIALLPALLTPLYIVAAFILFRFFDILKPWPVGWADKKLGGAWGVMMDDVFAGIMAAILIGGARVYGIG